MTGFRYTFQCAHCGADFGPNRHNAITCSISCKGAVYRDKIRGERAELAALKSARVGEALALLDMIEAGTIVVKQAGE